jgi:ribokinase
MTESDSSAGVLIIGSINADLTTFSSRLPAPGETLLGDDFSVVLGGKGANQAVAAGRAGGQAHMVGCVGDDVFSSMLLDDLTASGVGVEHVRSVAGPSGIAHIRVDAAGENNIVVVPLANGALSADHIDAAIADLAPRCRVMLTQLETPQALTLHAVRRSREAGLTVILDPAPAATLDDSIWPLIHIVTPNETEATLLTGIRVTDVASAVEAGRWFTARGTGAALITLAAAGAVLVTAETVEHFEAFRVTVVDTTAAGDTFAGYLGASLAAGNDRTDAIRRAIAAGALTVTRRGASPSIPTSAEVATLLESAPAAG